MDLKIIGKHIEVTESIEGYIEDKLNRFEHFFNNDVSIKVTVSARKSNHKIEVTIIPSQGPILRAEDSENDLYIAIDRVYDKIYKQLRKYKTRLQKYNHKSIRTNFIEPLELDNEKEDYSIIRKKKISMKPMSVEEAILQMELLGHNFFLFRNSENDNVNVLYKRKDSGYGLIEEY